MNMSPKMMLALGAGVIALAACGGKKEAEVKDATKAAEEVVATVEPAKKSIQDVAAIALEKANAYLAENAKKPGVMVTETGLQHETIKEGTGGAVEKGDYVTLHYTGTLADGSVFDSTRERGEALTVEVDRVNPGWREGISLLKEGGRTKVTLPPELGYGAYGTPDGSIGPNEVIILDLELIKVTKGDDKEGIQKIRDEQLAKYKARQEEMMAERKKAIVENAAKAKAFLAENAKKDGILTTKSGLQYEIIKKGNSKVSPKATDKVEVHYHGTLIDGHVFDSSVERGETIAFGLNRVIPGWTEGVQMMSEGDKYRFYIKPELAYGERGKGDIGPNELLIFDIELFDVQGKGDK